MTLRQTHGDREDKPISGGELKDLRCPICQWRLARVRGSAVIETKCKNCKQIVTVRIVEISEGEQVHT